MIDFDSIYNNIFINNLKEIAMAKANEKIVHAINRKNFENECMSYAQGHNDDIKAFFALCLDITNEEITEEKVNNENISDYIKLGEIQERLCDEADNMNIESKAYVDLFMHALVTCLNTLYPNVDWIVRLRLEQIENRLFEHERQIENRFAEHERQINDLKTKITQNNILKTPLKSLHIDNANKYIKRTNDINEILNMFHNNQQYVFIYGRFGIGKTTLSKCVANEWVNDERYLYYINYSNNLEDSLCTLLLDDNKPSVNKVIDQLNQLIPEEKNNLMIIIDNFETGEPIEREVNNGCLKKLIDTGVKILITTRTCVGNNSFEVKPLNDSFKLFKTYYSNKDHNLDECRTDIENVCDELFNNTLLIILVSQIWKYGEKDLNEELRRKVHDCKLKDISKRINVASGVPLDEDSAIMYDQISAMIDINKICNSDITNGNKYVLSNVALLPIVGMKKGEFEDAICSNEFNINQAIDYLSRRYWIINEEDCYKMHPAIKEVVLAKLNVKLSDCNKYCKYILEKTNLDLGISKKYPYKKYADEIYNYFNDCKDEQIILLSYYMSDIYDLINDRNKAKVLVSKVEAELDVIQDTLIKNRIKSGIAYSYINYYKSKEVPFDIAIEGMSHVEELLDSANDDCLSELLTLHESDNSANRKRECIKIIAQIFNNKGAMYLGYNGIYSKGTDAEIKSVTTKNKDELIPYTKKQALLWHTLSLNYRVGLLDIINGNKEETNYENELSKAYTAIARAYTAIATDYYYLSDYHKAIIYHKKALDIRLKNDMEGDAAINQQRIIGCALSIDECEEKKILIWEVLEYYPNILNVFDELNNTSAYNNCMNYLIKICDYLREHDLNEEEVKKLKPYERYINS